MIHHQQREGNRFPLAFPRSPVRSTSRSLVALASAITLLATPPVGAAEPAQAATPIVLRVVGASSANVWLLKPGDRIDVDPKKVYGDEACLKASTDTNGIVRFNLPSADAAKPYFLLALADNGYALASAGESELRIQPWVQISGTAHVGKSPEAGRKVQGWAFYSPFEIANAPSVMFFEKAVTDAQGRYQLSSMPALDGHIAFADDEDSLYPRWELQVVSKNIRQLDIGSTGPRLQARLLLPSTLTSWNDVVSPGDAWVRPIEPAFDPVRPPPDVAAQGILAEADWARRYEASDEGKQRAQLRAERSSPYGQKELPVSIGPDGRVTVPYGLTPGEYKIAGRLYRKLDNGNKYLLSAKFSQNFTVLPNDDRTIIDLGDIQATGLTRR